MDNKIELNIKEVQMALKLFEGISDDCDLIIQDNTFRISVVSPCNSMMGQYVAKCGDLTNCDGMLEIKDFQTALKRCKKNNLITMTNEQLLVKHDKGFVALRLKDRPAGAFKELPQLHFQAVFEADCSEINGALSPLISMSGGDSESIVFSIEDNVQNMQKNEQSETDLKLTYTGLKGTSEQIVRGRGTGQAKAMYGVSYLGKLFAVPLKVKISLSVDYPMQIEYVTDSVLTVVLAPRVTNN